MNAECKCPTSGMGVDLTTPGNSNSPFENVNAVLRSDVLLQQVLFRKDPSHVILYLESLQVESSKFKSI
jgi:hypothetical protein